MRLSLLALVIAPAGVYANAPAFAELTRDVGQIGSPGIPGPVSVIGETAFPVVLGKDGMPVVSAAQYGRGRVVVFGHGGYFSRESWQEPNTQKLVRNSLRWTLNGSSKPIALWQGSHLEGIYREAGLQTISVANGSYASTLPRAGTVVLDMGVRVTDADRSALLSYVRNGGGLILSGLGWGWRQLNDNKSLAEEFPWNRVIAPMGLVISDGYSDDIAPVATWEKTSAASAVAALERIRQGSKSQIDEALVTTAFGSTPKETPFADRVRKAVTAAGATGLPTPQKPLKRDQPLARLAVVIENMESRRRTPGEIKAAPGASAFPGAVETSKRSTPTVELNLAVPAWKSTGYYAAPGEVITVEVPDSLVGKAALQIGAHSDELWHHDQWQRSPSIVYRAPINSRTVSLANPFGGLVYIDLPRPLAGTANVTLRNVVPAPRFVLGKTTNAEWHSTMKLMPGPWTELETPKVILTVPTEVARKIEDPEALMKHWDRALDLYLELGTRPLPIRPERIVSDVQISAGYMHSGYPIMTWLDAASYGTDLKHLTTEGSWGHWHELGHNHQQGAWTFDGTGEVTCNLFTLYAMEKLANQGLWARIGEVKPRYEAHIKSGAPFDKWKSDPFLALYMYAQLIEAFGWDALKKVMADYRDAKPETLPKNDAEKRDQWMVRYSRVIGRNLGPFFQAWGVPTSEAARRSISDLPTWLPKDFPAKS